MDPLVYIGLLAWLRTGHTTGAQIVPAMEDITPKPVQLEMALELAAHRPA